MLVRSLDRFGHSQCTVIDNLPYDFTALLHVPKRDDFLNKRAFAERNEQRLLVEKRQMNSIRKALSASTPSLFLATSRIYVCVHKYIGICVGADFLLGNQIVVHA
jgi:hypothetical protein